MSESELIEKLWYFEDGYTLDAHDAEIIQRARLALSATPQAAQVPAGYALVPVEPTQAMLDAAGVCPVHAGKEWLDKSNREVWAAMLAANARGGCHG